MRRLPAVAVLLALLCPLGARAADPTVLVATAADGSLVRLTLTGRVATAQVLVQGDGAYHVPTQANGASVAFTTFTQVATRDIENVSLLDARTGVTRRLSRDGRSSFLLVSRDGNYRYVLRSNGIGVLSYLVRTDAHTGRTRTLLAVTRNDAWLSGASLTTDGRTVYLASTRGTGPSDLLAVDTATGRAHALRSGVTDGVIFNVVVSPDGRTLAVSWSDGSGGAHVSLVPVAGGDARELSLPLQDLAASAFTPDGSAVVLTVPVSERLPVTHALVPAIHLGDVLTGAVTPVLGTDGMFQAVAVS